MATTNFAINYGQSRPEDVAVTTTANSPSNSMELVINTGVAVTKREALRQLETISRRIMQSDWPLA